MAHSPKNCSPVMGRSEHGGKSFWRVGGVLVAALLAVACNHDLATEELKFDVAAADIVVRTWAGEREGTGRAWNAETESWDPRNLTVVTERTGPGAATFEVNGGSKSSMEFVDEGFYYRLANGAEVYTEVTEFKFDAAGGNWSFVSSSVQPGPGGDTFDFLERMSFDGSVITRELDIRPEGSDDSYQHIFSMDYGDPMPS